MFLEEYVVGQRFDVGSYLLEEEELVEFASRYDPHPRHTDPEEAAALPFGGLMASGFQTLAIAWGLCVRYGLTKDNYAGFGLDELRWLLPVRPGDMLSGVATVISKDEPRKGRGRMRMLVEMWNQHQEQVLTVKVICVVNCRPGGTGEVGSPG